MSLTPPNFEKSNIPERPKITKGQVIYLKNSDVIWTVIDVGWDFWYDNKIKVDNPGVGPKSLRISKFFDQDSWKWVDLNTDVDKEKSNIKD